MFVSVLVKLIAFLALVSEKYKLLEPSSTSSVPIVTIPSAPLTLTTAPSAEITPVAELYVTLLPALTEALALPVVKYRFDEPSSTLSVSCSAKVNAPVVLL